MGLENHEIQGMESLKNLILKVMKVKFPLQENYFKVSLFTFIVIFIDFSLFSDHEKKKKYWTSTC